MKKSFFGVMALAVAFVFGTMMSCDKQEEVVPMQVAEVNAQLDSLVGDTILIEGTVEHICQHSGMKMVLEGAEFHCVSETVFADSLMSQKVRVNGVVCEQRMTAEDIAQMEEMLRLKHEQDSINAANPEAAACPDKKECCEHNDSTKAEEGEHQCCGEHHDGEECPCKKLAGYKEQLAKNMEEGKDYIVVGYYVQVISVETVAEEVAE